MRLSGQGGVFFVVPSVPHHIQNQTPHQTAWILDRMVVSVGTVVPQRLWIPHTTTGIRQHVAEAELQMPIFFQHTNGNLGLSLEAAMNGRSHTLINVQRFAPLGPRVKTYIRIGVSVTVFLVNFPFTESTFSGQVIKISGARFRSVMKRLIGIPSHSANLSSTLGKVWMPFSG